MARHRACVDVLRSSRVVILGAGPAGLAVSRLLQLRGIATLILERDHDPDVPTQGGSLDLTEGGGLRVIEALGLRDQFSRVARPEGQSFRVLDADAHVHADLHRDDFPYARPEIDRLELRRLLLASVPAETVRWNSTVSAIVERPDGGYLIQCNHGDPVEADVVVACDGIGSLARRFVTSVVPAYCGVTFLQARITHFENESFIDEHVGDGAMFALGDDKAIMGQRNGDGTIRIYVALRIPRDPARNHGRAVGDGNLIRDQLRRVFRGWHPEFVALLDRIGGAYTSWPLYTMPADQRWTAHHHLTLLGDAAHVMPPFSGEGVNMALVDALDFVEALGAPVHRSLDEAIGAYEAGMLARMRVAIAEAIAGMNRIISPDGPEPLLAELR